MKRTDDEVTYAQMGMAALLPGMQYMVERMEAALHELREALLAAQGRKKPGRPPGPGKAAAPVTESRHAGWPADPAARKIEMRRRMAVAAAKNGTATKDGLHPRDPKHPDHDKWLAATRKAHKKAWARMTPEDRAARIAKAVAGRKLKAVA